MESNKKHKIDQRALTVLKLLIERYISSGQPIGSKTLMQGAELQMSAATVRNIMADLENAGFLHSPHTSAGRVPTVKGYRLFVDGLMTLNPVSEQEIEALQQYLSIKSSTKNIVASASTIISGITRLAGIVTMPLKKQILLKQVEFVSLSDKRILVILVMDNNEIHNRIIYSNRVYSADELHHVANFLTQKFINQDLFTIRKELLQEMRRDRDDMEKITSAIIDVANQTFNDEDPKDYVVSGEINLFSMADEAGIEKLRSLFEAFTHKSDILHLLDKCLQSENVQIYIGDESEYELFSDCSFIAKPYKVAGKIVGVLGVIGPTRIAYNRIVPAVDITANLLSAALGQL